MEIFLQKYSSNELINTGDFNIDLMTENTKFRKTFLNKGFSQLLCKPTRVTESSHTLIDHIWTNFPHHISGADVLDIAISDHKYVVFGRKVNYCLKPKIVKKLMF